MIESIYYKNSINKWRPLPKWARWMMQAGMQVGGSPKNETRLVLGLSLPVRNFASTFIAAGIIYERAENSIEHNDKYSYFEFLKSLHLLTPVSILVKTGGEWRRRPGKFEGIGND